MNKLEDQIIKKVYQFETKSTFLQLIVKLVSIIVFGLGGILLAIIIIRQLIEQQTFDVLEIFNEDFSVVKTYIGDVLYTLYAETPKVTLFASIITFIIAIFLIITLIKNANKIRNKLKSIIRYWRKH